MALIKSIAAGTLALGGALSAVPASAAPLDTAREIVKGDTPAAYSQYRYGRGYARGPGYYGRGYYGRGYYGRPYGYRGYGRRGYGWGPGAAIAGGVLGLAAGAALAAPYYGGGYGYYGRPYGYYGGYAPYGYYGW